MSQTTGDAGRTATFRLGQTVTFRPDFSTDLVGVELIVDSTDYGQDPSGRQMIGVKRRNPSGRWGYRLAYTSDLIAVEQ